MNVVRKLYTALACTTVLTLQIHTARPVSAQRIPGLPGGFFQSGKDSPTETSFVREFAKGAPFTYIICSGDNALILGETLKNACYSHADKQKAAPGKIKAISIQEAEQLMGQEPQWATGNHVFLLNQAEMEADLPASLASLLPPGGKINPAIAWSGAKRLHAPGSPGLQHTVLLSAPDETSLARLVIRFIKQKATNGGRTEKLWQFMEFEETHKVNHVIVYSPNDMRKAIKDWGSLKDINPDDTIAVRQARFLKTLEALAGTEQPDAAPGAAADAWDYTEWRPLERTSKAEGARTAGCGRIYFVDRSDANIREKLPPIVQENAYQDDKKVDLGVFDTQVLRKDEHKIATVVFSAPNTKMLVGLAGIYKNVDAVPTEPIKNTCMNLQYIKNIALAIQGNELDPKKREQLHDILALSMRDDLLLDIDYKTGFYKEIASDAPTEDIIDYCCRKMGKDYVCIFKIIESDPKSVYDHRETPLFVKIAPWREQPPARSSFEGRKAGQEFSDALRDYNARKEQWRLAYYADCRWQRDLIIKSTCHVRGQISLMRVSDSRPLWEYEVNYNYEPEPEVVKTETVSVPGQDKQPDSILVPATSPTASEEVKFKAVKAAAHQACVNLQGNARLLLTGEVAPQDAMIVAHRRKHPYPGAVVDRTKIPDDPDRGGTIALRGTDSIVVEVLVATQQIIIEMSKRDADNMAVKAGRMGKMLAGSKDASPVLVAIRIDKRLPAKPDDPLHLPLLLCSTVNAADWDKIDKKGILSAKSPVTWDAAAPPKPAPPKTPAGNGGRKPRSGRR